MAKEMTERARLQAERRRLQDEARRAADAVNRAMFAELKNELYEMFGVDCEFEVMADKTVGLSFKLNQARALLNILNDMAGGDQ